MSFSVMLSQLAKGMTVTTEIFFVTLVFSLPLGLLVCWEKCPNTSDPVDCDRLYFHHARNAADAAADGSIFRSLFHFRNPHFHGLQPDCGIHCLYH